MAPAPELGDGRSRLRGRLWAAPAYDAPSGGTGDVEVRTTGPAVADTSIDRGGPHDEPGGPDAPDAPDAPVGPAGPIGPVDPPERPWALRHRYALLAAVVTVLTGLQTVNGQWSSDMWQHVAVVRELIARPFDPTNPQVLADAAHPGFSPYTVVLGIVGGVTGADAVTVLSIAAVVNVVLLLVAFRVFVIELTQNRRAPFWALVFVLALWGWSPLRFSGFFGLSSIGFVAPYPSMFATALALWVLVAMSRLTRDGRPHHLVVIAAGTAVVVIVHPLSGAWLVASLVVLAVVHLRDRRAWIGLVLAGTATVALCLLWPYYSVVALVLEGDEYDTTNRSMYTNIVARLLPTLLGLVVVVRRFRADRADRLGLLLAVGVLIYAGGWVTGHLAFGRSLALVVLVLDVALADGVGRIEATLRRGAVPGRVVAGGIGLGALLLVGVAASSSGLVRMVPPSLLPPSVRGSDELVRPDERYAVLADVVGPTDVVVGSTDRDDLVIPAIAGRTVRVGWATPFIADQEQRRDDAEAIVDPATAADRRAELLERHDVRFVVVHPSTDDGRDLLRALEASGATIAARTDDLAVVRVDGS